MNRGYTPSSIAQIVTGKVSGDREVWIQEYCIDSRKAYESSSVMFIALNTARQNGHDYVSSAYEKGIRCFLVQQKCDLPQDAIQIEVENPLRAIQELAAFHRSQFNIPVIGITGSNGKTIVKEWLNQLLSKHYKICRSPRSYNSQIGVPLSVLQLNESHELAIFEAGISEPKEMRMLQQIIRPTIGVFTHLGVAHLENFLSQEALLLEKCELFQQAHCWISPQMQLVGGPLNNHHTWGSQFDNKWVIGDLKNDLGGGWVSINEEGRSVEVHFPFQDIIQVNNAITAVVTARMVGLDWQEIIEEVPNLSSVDMRMERLTGINQTIIINDAYSFDLPSLTLAMQESFQRYPNRYKVLICSDFPSPAERISSSYTALIQRISQYDWKHIFWVGNVEEDLKSQFPKQTVFFDTTDALISFITQVQWQDELILVKGARAFEFERVVHRLQESHQLTRLEINMEALRSNLQYYRSKIDPSTKMMVMVKAFGYGTGAKEVAQLLEETRVDYLGVAYIDEGIGLRRAGVSLPIMVMNPEKEGIHALLHYQLEPEIYSVRSLRDWLFQKDRYSSTAGLKVHLKIDTGMHRLGLMETEWEEMKDLLMQREDVEVVSIFSHFSSADIPEEDVFTLNQLQLFEKAKQYFHSFFPKAFYHIANTAAIGRIPASQMDMVRLGIGIYGVASDPRDQRHLQAVHRWVSYISQVKYIPKGDSIGYGRSYRAEEAMKMATIPVGYADGYKRMLSNGKGWVWVNGAKAPIVGRVCMDMLMIDISGINAQEGDEVVLLGGEMTLDEMARQCQTIPYEILTSISQRVKRIYIGL